ncbi:uncharacterized protein LOC120266583 [Dioscorea cayenensis subsp. rotundata]|uniref:Uncharacterized protein LOC120266583 n=1 Tax=Dioscorea cayennensis subsp. rotundata TaxID=55577 RepID=A0AB40BV87_DIOCR|nr:uncharacterized protein LOC120266583 [Dioscorea cayenensis subsp. rotundata]
MAATSSPVEIGARGTIAFLVSKEIEYFQKQKHGINHQEGSHKQKTVIEEGASTSGSSIATKSKKKKASVSKAFLPSICSAVDINNSAVRVERIVGISNNNRMRSDGNKLPQI